MVNGTLRDRHHAAPASSPTAVGPPIALAVDPAALAPLVRVVVAETMAAIERDRAAIPDDGPLAYDEPTAARMLGLEPHQLRDERLRGRIGASKIVGGRVRYARQDLLDYLSRNRTNATD